ncbi:hypothetical protein ABT234_38690 [Streptomyces sp. NPDC001586]|uniref:hypothetical protein n=1 Tax=Streptomyces sp. NPDC001586 TaxID=3154387 RepID=UPI003328B68F
MVGRFIHHDPKDEEDVDYGVSSTSKTVKAMKAKGIAVNDDLWNATTFDTCGSGGC